jgi:hypothetical protein
MLPEQSVLPAGRTNMLSSLMQTLFIPFLKCEIGSSMSCCIDIVRINVIKTYKLKTIVDTQNYGEKISDH